MPSLWYGSKASLRHACDGPPDPQSLLHADTFQPDREGPGSSSPMSPKIPAPFTYVPGSHRLTAERLALGAPHEPRRPPVVECGKPDKALSELIRRKLFVARIAAAGAPLRLSANTLGRSPTPSAFHAPRPERWARRFASRSGLIGRAAVRFLPMGRNSFPWTTAALGRRKRSIVEIWRFSRGRRPQTKSLAGAKPAYRLSIPHQAAPLPWKQGARTGRSACRPVSGDVIPERLRRRLQRPARRRHNVRVRR